MNLLMVVGYSNRPHDCSRCGRHSDYRANLLMSPPDRFVHVCIECYVALVSGSTSDACAGGSCET